MAIVGTRPEIIKLSRILHEIEKFHQLVIVHTGQNYDYELNEIFFTDLQIRRPDHFLNAAGETAAETIGLVIARVDAVLQAEQPDAVLLYGDTNSCLAVIPAKRRKIPIFHFEAGNRCFDQRGSENLLENYLMTGATNNRWEYGARSIISCESGFAHTASVINNKSCNFVFHFSAGLMWTQNCNKQENTLTWVSTHVVNIYRPLHYHKWANGRKWPFTISNPDNSPYF